MPGLPFLVGLVCPEVIHSKFAVREDSGVKKPLGPSLLAPGLDFELWGREVPIPLSLVLGPRIMCSHVLRMNGKKE